MRADKGVAVDCTICKEGTLECFKMYMFTLENPCAIWVHAIFMLTCYLTSISFAALLHSLLELFSDVILSKHHNIRCFAPKAPREMLQDTTSTQDQY